MANDLNRSIRIYIDGSDAQAGIAKVQAAVQKLEAQLAGLNKIEANYEQRSKELQQELSNKNRTLETYRRKVQETERVLNNLSGATYQELLAVQKQVRRELQNAVPGTEKYNAALEQNRRVTQQVAAAQKAMRVEVGAQGTLMGRVADGFNRYAGIAAGAIASLTGVTLTVRQCVDEYAEMEEALSQVTKYTGMTREEVDQLNEQFKQMDTRTSREELNRLAGEAGKLGITGVEDVRDFVEAANQINVALGEDLGEEAVNQIGKLSQMFGDESRSLKENMLAIGSAVNQVAQSTSASEPYLVQFTARMGGVGKQAGLAVTDIMGFASALDQNMLRSEMASTALSGLIIRIYQEPAKFAKMAQLDVEDFTKTVQTDANEAVIQFLESLNKMGGMAQMAPILKEMQLSGAEAASVISTLAGNIDLVRKEQENANRAYREATSITNEYNVQNNTVQAELEKARKKFQDVRVELGEKLQPVMKNMISLGGLTVKGLLSIIEICSQYGRTLTTLTILVGTYVAAQKAEVAIAKLVELWNGKIVASFRKLWAVMAANPWAALVALAATFIAYMHDAGRAMSAVERQQKLLNQASREAEGIVKNERNQLEALLKTARDKTLSDQERKRAIEELNRISPEYLGNLNLENINTTEADKAIQKYTASILANAKAKALNAQLDKLEQEKQELQANPEQLTHWYDPLTTGMNNVLSGAERVRNTLGTLFTRGNLSGWNEQTRMEQEYATSSLDAWGRRYTAKMKQIIEDEKRLKEELEKVVKETVTIRPDEEEEEEIFTTFTTSSTPTTPGSNAEKQRIAELSALRDQDLKDAEAYYQAVQNAYRLSLEQQRITQEQYEALAASLEQNRADKLLDIEQQYYRQSQDLAVSDADLKKKAVQDAADRVAQAEQQSFDKRLAAEQAYRRNLDALRQMAADTPSTPEAKLEAEYQTRLALLESYYQASLDYAEKHGQDETAVTELYNQAKLKLEQKYQDERLKLNEEADTRLQALQGNDISQQFTQMYNGIKDLQDAVDELDFTKIAQSLQSLTNTVLGGISSAFSTFKQIEIDNVEAKYDAEIEAAAGNQEKIEQLEHDKAAAKLEIEKKYADKEFAVKASQIIANTALAIMMAFAQLGPVAGAVAAALMTATGAIQLAAANAEREKVKNLTLDGSGSSSSSSGSGRRVATGRTAQHAAGRYDVIGAEDGRTYRDVPYIGESPTGIVRRPALISENGAELIVNAEDLGRLRRHVNYPLVVQAINDSRRPSPQAAPLPQHAAGNYAPMAGASPSSGGRTATSDAILARLADTLESLQRDGINASVALTELERKQQLRDRSRRIGAKK